MDLGLKDKVVLCMASAAGLGKGIATEMAREGAKVMICTAEPFKDQLLEAQAEIEKETGNRPETFLCDVNKPEDIDALKAKQAADAAKEAMLQKQSIREYHTAQMTLARAVARLRVKNSSEQ